MPSSSKRGLALALVVGAVLSGLIAYSAPLGLDYFAPPCHPHICADGAPAIDALAAGRVHSFFANQPPMGSFSLLVRAPCAAIGDALSGKELLKYRLGAFVCLLALAGLAVALMAAMARQGRSRTACILIPAAVLVNPLTYSALDFGHPEELLGAALCAGAVLAAARGRAVWAGVLLGCALATKQWAALAILPMLLAAPRGSRMRAGGVMAAVAGLLVAPMMIADPGRFWLAQKSLGLALTYQHTVTASNVWFPFAQSSTGLTPDGGHAIAQFSLPSAVGHLIHPLVIGAVLAVAVAYAYRRRGVAPEEALQLVALVMLVRCLLDPLTYSYHHAPFLVALVSYEALRRRVPVLSGFAITALLLMKHVIVPMKDASLVNAFYLGWTLPLAVALGVAVLAPGRLPALLRRAGAPPRDARHITAYA